MQNAPEGALAETAGQGVTESVPHDTVTIRQPRWCKVTRAYCRCDLVDLERVTMAVCGRHFLDEVSGHE
jgi:hypothetical protein